MDDERVQQAQAAALPRCNLDHLAGQWVAICNDEVIASGINSEPVRHLWGQAGVTVMLVPFPGVRI